MSATKSSIPADSPEWLAIVREKVESLRFGVVQIVVHDRKVTQIERTEKTRLDSSEAEATARRPGS
ncbi:MAG: YezD family protein [Opitutaceae bacterium]|nr:YezD family protein [Opitutaceae bacterium]